jgi:hypothetical protein
MCIIGLLGGKTKEEWYDEIAKRVANGDGPCAPPEYGKLHYIPLGAPKTNGCYQLNSAAQAFITTLMIVTVGMMLIWTNATERLAATITVVGSSSLEMVVRF